MFLELRGEKWDHPASSRSINGSMPSIIEVFKTSSDERTSLSRIFHGRKGRSLVLKTGATLFPCKGRRGSNEGTGETWNSPRGGKRRSSDYHNVIVCLDNRLVVYSSRGETAPPEESRVFSSFPFLFSFSFLFFPSFFLSFSLDVCARKTFSRPISLETIILLRSFYYSHYIRVFFFFFSFNKCWGKIFLEGKLLLEIIRLILRSNLIFDHDASYIYFFRFLFRFDSVYVDVLLSRKNLETFNFISLPSRLVNINSKV